MNTIYLISVCITFGAAVLIAIAILINQYVNGKNIQL